MKQTVAILILLLGSSAFSETWHVRKAGNDALSGHTWDSAFATWHSGAVDSIGGGDTVMFGAGRYDTTRIDLVDAWGGTYAVPTVFLDSMYDATGNQGAGATISSAQYVTDWISHSGSIYKSEWNPGARFVYNDWSQSMAQNDTAMVPRQNLGAVVEAGLFYHDGDTVWAWLWGDANPSSQTMTITCEPTITVVPGASDADHIQFKGLYLRMGQQAVFLIRAGADSVVLIHCNIDGPAGHTAGENPALIMSRAFPNTGNYDLTDFGTYNRTTACSLSQNYCIDGTYPYFNTVSGEHRGNGLTLYTQHRFTIDSCVFTRLPGFATDFKVTQWLDNQVDSIFVTANVVKFNEIIGLPVYRNDTLVGSAGGSKFFCGGLNDSAYGNTYRNISELVVGLYNCRAVGGHFVGNNSFYNCDTDIRVHHGPAGDRVPDSTSTFKYNYGAFRAILNKYTGSSFGNAGFWDVDAGSLVELNATNIFDSNGWYDTVSLNFGYNANYSIAQWQGVGNDANADEADPLFTDPANGDFSRPDTTTAEMNVTYGGKTWTIFGAIQNEAVTDSTKASMTGSAILKDKAELLGE